MCDTCFTHSHNEHEIELEHSSDAKKQSVKNIFSRTKDAYLLAHQLHLRIKTSHRYANLVQVNINISISKSMTLSMLDSEVDV